MSPIRYTIVPCSLGRLLLAATQRGVCALALDDSDAPLLRFVHTECEPAELVRDDAGLAAWAARIVSHLDDQSAMPNLPVDARGTTFQKRVWHELTRIPLGRTRTYTQIAHAIGRPEAVRAVARACATNPVSVLVPCHRVVRTDGNLAGYRWGLERKQTLLQYEAAR